VFALQSQLTVGHDLAGSFRFNTHLLLAWVHDLATSAAVVDPVANLLGPDVLLWSSDWVEKKAMSPGFFSFHQDSTYAGLDSPAGVNKGGDFVTVWLALTETTLANGCLQFALGSHKRRQLPHYESRDPENMLSQGQTVQGEAALLRKREGQDNDAAGAGAGGAGGSGGVGAGGGGASGTAGHVVQAAELLPGWMSIHQSYTLHGSGMYDCSPSTVSPTVRPQLIHQAVF
jgi:ectoine hydroxylase-related dioxygenase (phytanoyl-CoA dioxygenase family)